jgi:hypothetical protein
MSQQGGKMRKSCKDCKFFRKLKRKRGKVGECRRFPPVPCSTSYSVVAWVFPVVRENWWCGEFQEREVKDERES